MPHKAITAWGMGLFTVAGMVLSSGERPVSVAREPGLGAIIEIPVSVQTEHAAIHTALSEATKAAGRVGESARDLAVVLHPHFVREEQIALPPLGALVPLARGARLPEPEAAAMLTMTDALRRELPQMLEEHKQIRLAVENLRVAARAEHASSVEQLATELALHAQTEEEVLYPAAVLVGDLIRAQMQRGSSSSQSKASGETK